MKQVLPVILRCPAVIKKIYTGMYQAATYYAKQNHTITVNQGKVRRICCSLKNYVRIAVIFATDIKSMEDVAEREKNGLWKILKDKEGEYDTKEDIVYQQYQALSEEASRLPD